MSGRLVPVSGRRSASPGRLGPPPREIPSSHGADNTGDEQCLLPCPLDELSELHRDSLNRRQGRLFVLDGVTYYSPNSTANVSVPKPFPEGKVNAFRRTRAVLKDFQVPLWYDKRHRSLPFVPAAAFFDDLICAPLRRCMETEDDFSQDEDGRWLVPKAVVDEWMKIENQTNWLITWLEAYRRPYQRTIRQPSDVGLQRRFSSIRHAVFFVRRTKDWFMLLFSYATWLLSDHNVFSDPNREQSPLWQHLIDHEVDVKFLHSFVNSTIVCISSQVPRVGCFFDIATYDENLGRTADQLRRFLYNSIPVWIPLDDTTWKVLNTPELRMFKPPSIMWKAFETDRMLASIPRDPMYKDPIAVNAWRNAVAEEAGILSPKPVPWRVFFERREESNMGRLRMESQRERQRRLDRERYSLTGWSGTATYFKWVPDEKDGTRTRTRVDKDDVRVEMIRHAPAQRRFDAFANEWDICTEFGSVGDYDRRNLFYEEGDSEEEDDEMEGGHPALANPGPYTLPEVVVEDSPASPPPTPERQPGFEHTRHLTGRMGARIPLLFGLCLEWIPSTIDSPGDLHRKHVYRALGGESQPNPLLDVPVNGLLYHFVLTFVQRSSTGSFASGSSINFDLDPLSPSLQETIRSTVTLGEGVYLVKPIATNPCPTIVVYHPEAAIFCCRLEDRDFESMVTSLFKHGIQFNCCVESSNPAPPPSSEFIFPVVPPVVSADSVVDKGVYDRFLESRRLFLVGHRRRAALLQGGLVSRIARDVIGNEAECERLVLQDPSPTVLSCSDNIVADMGDGFLLYDDILAPYEVDYILGAHLHLKGDPSEYRYHIESWWPRGSVIRNEEYNVYHWYWDDHNEHWYGRNALALSSLDKFPAPKRTSKWKKDSHVPGAVKDFYRGYKSLCSEILTSILA